MKNILIPIEHFSQTVLNAASRAAEIAALEKINVILIYIKSYVSGELRKDKNNYDEEAVKDKKQLDFYRDYMDFKAKSKICISARIVRGNYAAAIQEVIGKANISAIMMPADESKSVTRRHMQMLKNCAVPLCLIPAQQTKIKEHGTSLKNYMKLIRSDELREC